MRELKIKEKAGSLTITHKLSKQEQVNPMELDIVQKGEISTLLPIQLISSFSGIKLRFTITQEVRIIDYLSSGITFGQFLQVVRRIVKTILACQARGISVNNLELEDSFLFLDFRTKRARLLYWPITSVTEDVDLVGFFIRLGSRYYCANSRDESNRREYLDLFNSRAVFDAQRFDGQLEQLQKKWLEALQQQEKRPRRGREDVPQGMEQLLDGSNLTPYLLRVSTNTRIELNKFPFIIGREPGACDYVLEQNNYVSRQHLRLLQQRGRVYLQDSGTRNGTTVNGERIPPKYSVPLSSGCVIELGREAFYFFAAGSNEKMR